MKKRLIFAFAIATASTAVFIKTSQSNQHVLNDIVLMNIEALADNETEEEEYFCYGDGTVVCPSSGKLVGGYFKTRSLK